MNEPSLCERTFAHGPQRWRVDSSGKWSTLMFGWWPDSNGTPSYRWRPIETDRVPNELKKAAK